MALFACFTRAHWFAPLTPDSQICVVTAFYVNGPNHLLFWRATLLKMSLAYLILLHARLASNNLYWPMITDRAIQAGVTPRNIALKHRFLRVLV